jgi:ketosteroid isomerase-like protein
MMPPNEAPIRGKPAMETWYRTFLSAFRTTTLVLTDREVTVSDSSATEPGQYQWGLQPSDGGDPVVDKGNYMQIWKRAPDGSWLFSRNLEQLDSICPASQQVKGRTRRGSQRLPA